MRQLTWPYFWQSLSQWRSNFVCTKFWTICRQQSQIYSFEWKVWDLYSNLTEMIPMSQGTASQQLFLSHHMESQGHNKLIKIINQMVNNTLKSYHFSNELSPYIEGILPKWPYLPCVSMGMALLAGYHWYNSCNNCDVQIWFLKCYGITILNTQKI